MSELDTLIQLLAKLPGLGPRSARRAALFLVKRREPIMQPLAAAMEAAATAVRPCSICGNLDTSDPCAICYDPKRDQAAICVVEDLADLWALERSGVFRGRYHVLGGTLSALDGVGPEEFPTGIWPVGDMTSVPLPTPRHFRVGPLYPHRNTSTRSRIKFLSHTLIRLT